MTETIVGSLCGLTGHTYDIIYDLLFTSERVIGVLIQHPADVPPYKSSFGWQNLIIGNWNAKRNERMEQGKMMISRQEKFDNAGDKISLDDLLKSHRFNFEIRYENVISVQVKKGIFDIHLKFEMKCDDSKTKKRNLGVPRNKLSDTRELIEIVLSDKTKK